MQPAVTMKNDFQNRGNSIIIRYELGSGESDNNAIQDDWNKSLIFEGKKQFY